MQEAVHTPYDKAPGDPTGDTYTGMLWRSDVYIGQMVAALKARGMWNNTLIVYSGDNGGVSQGNNFPLRGGASASLRRRAPLRGSATSHAPPLIPLLCILPHPRPPQKNTRTGRAACARRPS